jgi:hypothetical protein
LAKRYTYGCERNANALSDLDYRDAPQNIA